MVTDEQNKLSIDIINLLKKQQQNWISKQNLKQNLQLKSLNDFEFVLKDLEYFRIIEIIRNGLNVRLLENARGFRGLTIEFSKKERIEKIRFWITTMIAILSFFLALWVAVVNNELQEISKQHDTTIKILNSDLQDLRDELNKKTLENKIMREKMDSTFGLFDKLKNK